MYSSYKNILEHIHSGVLYCKNDEHSTIIYANEYFYKMIGYTREEIEEEYGNRFADFVVDDVSDILVTIDEKVAKNEDLDYEYRMKRKDGSIFWVHDTAKYDKENNCWFVTIMDITEMKSLDYERERLEFYLDSVPNKIVISDECGKIIYKNKEAEECSYFDKKAENLSDLIGNNILGKDYEDIYRQVIQGSDLQFETRFKKETQFIGHDRNYLNLVDTSGKDGKNIMMISENILRNCDILTDFPTRAMFESYYHFYVNEHPDKNAYLCIIDIDDFKQINDNYGHDIGDKAISETSNRIKAFLDKEDYVCRYGGDEFLILMVGKPIEKITENLNSLIESSKNPITEGINKIKMSYSIGLVSVSKDDDFQKAFNKADSALYEVKTKGKNYLLEYIKKDEREQSFV